MKIGVVSDSHGQRENLRRAVKDMHEAGVEVIVHLGDDYDDVKSLSDHPRARGLQHVLSRSGDTQSHHRRVGRGACTAYAHPRDSQK